MKIQKGVDIIQKELKMKIQMLERMKQCKLLEKMKQFRIQNVQDKILEKLRQFRIQNVLQRN